MEYPPLIYSFADYLQLKISEACLSFLAFGLFLDSVLLYLLTIKRKVLKKYVFSK